MTSPTSEYMKQYRTAQTAREYPEFWAYYCKIRDNSDRYTIEEVVGAKHMAGQGRGQAMQRKTSKTYHVTIYNAYNDETPVFESREWTKEAARRTAELYTGGDCDNFRMYYVDEVGSRTYEYTYTGTYNNANCKAGRKSWTSTYSLHEEKDFYNIDNVEGNVYINNHNKQDLNMFNKKIVAVA